MKDFFIAMGITCTFVFGCVFLCFIFMLIKSGITYLINRYRVKHRFDKKPLPKCYCIDCVNSHTDENGRFCPRVKKYVANNWFCWEAEPNIPCEYIKKGES